MHTNYNLEKDDLVLTPDSLQWYKERYEERLKLADEVKADSGECEFRLGDSLRVTWIPLQRADKNLGGSSNPLIRNGVE